MAQPLSKLCWQVLSAILLKLASCTWMTYRKGFTPLEGAAQCLCGELLNQAQVHARASCRPYLGRGLGLRTAERPDDACAGFSLQWNISAAAGLAASWTPNHPILPCAQVLLHHRLGREWRREVTGACPPQLTSLLRLFWDSPGPQHYYSIHHVCQAGGPHG